MDQIHFWSVQARFKLLYLTFKMPQQLLFLSFSRLFKRWVAGRSLLCLHRLAGILWKLQQWLHYVVHKLMSFPNPWGCCPNAGFSRWVGILRGVWGLEEGRVRLRPVLRDQMQRPLIPGKTTCPASLPTPSLLPVSNVSTLEDAGTLVEFIYGQSLH